jgi:chromosome segregation ATPase
MNLAGKILIVALFIMSAMFATFSIMVYSAQHNWHDEITRTAPIGSQDVGLKEQYKNKTVENERLTTQRNNLEEQLRNDKGLKIQALTTLEAMSVALYTEFATRAEQLKAKEAELAANTTKLHASETQLADLTNQVSNLRNQIAQTQDETKAQINRSLTLNDKLANTTGQLSVLQERNEQLKSEVRQAQPQPGDRDP